MDKITEKYILLVDDENDILDLMETVLIKEGFHNILKANCGKKAIKICRDEAPDVVVLDIRLPDIDGYEVCREIRQFSMIPILFLSAKSDEIDKLLSFALGGDEYITKPFSPKEVVYRIKAILNREEYHKNASLDKYKIGELEICEAEGVVRKNGKELQMTAMELKLLFYMAKNRNIVLSKQKIIEEVWGYDFEGFDNTLMVHIRHLREKIEDNPSEPRYIQTIKKMGYKLVG